MFITCLKRMGWQRMKLDSQVKAKERAGMLKRESVTASDGDKAMMIIRMKRTTTVTVMEKYI